MRFIEYKKLLRKPGFSILAAFFVAQPGIASAADDDYKIATVISADRLQQAQDEADPARVSDQPIRHVSSARGRLGLGVVHRPVIEPGGPVNAIQHHRQSEVYRVMAGKGVLATGTAMTGAESIDPDGYVVQNLVGPSARGVLEKIDARQPIAAGDVIIIPAGVAHGFSEITEAITYMVVRIDPDGLVALK